MRYLVLACDYDGTIAHDGRVDEPTLAALTRVRESGRRLLLVTGRELEDLKATFAHLELFEWIVAENGALLYKPATHEVKALAPPPPAAFVQKLEQRGVRPVSVGHAQVAEDELREERQVEADEHEDRADAREELRIHPAGHLRPPVVQAAHGDAAPYREQDRSPAGAIGRPAGKRTVK